MLDVTTYTDYQYLYDAAHTMKQMLEKRLLVDISSMQEMIQQNEIHTTQINKEKQLSDILTNLGVPSEDLLNALSTLKVICKEGICA